MRKKKKQPDLRFKGFRGDWEKKEFSNTFDSSIPTNILSRASLNYEQGVVKNIHYGDVLIKFGEITDVSKEEIPFITDTNVTKYKNQFLENGDIIFADAAEDEVVGKATEISGITDEKVVSGLHTIACRPIKSNSTGYWGYFLNSSVYHNQLLSLMQGIKVLSISKRSLAITFVNYPNEKEQTKIGELFKNLDNLIALKQSKYDKLISIKKACLGKMFPKDGADIPDLRFKGFNGKWMQCKIGDVIKDYVEKTVVKNQYPVLTSSQQLGIVLQEKYFAGRQVTTNDNIGYYVLPRGYFTYRSTSDTGLFVFNRNNIIDEGVISYHYPVFCVNNSDSNFLLRRLNHALNRQISMAAEGTSQKVLAHGKFKSMDIMVTEIEEQTKIGEFFQTLDNLITLRKTELDKLKNIKKALLEKMFI